MASTSSDAAQIQIRFVTKQEKYAVPDYPLSVHTSIVVSELNTLVNELLRESNGTQKEEEFDFLVSSHLLRTSLAEHIVEKGISTEAVIDVEYVKKYPPPQPKDCLIQDDWISAVAVFGKWILTGSYDNTLHIWTTKGKHQLVIPGHTGPVKAVAWLSVDDNNASFVSVSHDQSAKIWNWNIVDNIAKCVLVCNEHQRGLEALSVNHDKTLIATGGWDNVLKIWSTSTEDETQDESAPKKPRMNKLNKTRVANIGANRTLLGHKSAISSTIWSDKAEVITVSWDHTLKVWDTELGGIKHEIIGNEVFFDAHYSPLSRAVITSSSDNHLRLYDPRSSEGTIVKTIFKSHTGWVHCVRWSTVDEHLFISGGFDSFLKLWDTRSPKAPLYDLTGSECVTLCCDWSDPKLIVSGGQDNTLRIYKSKH